MSEYISPDILSAILAGRPTASDRGYASEREQMLELVRRQREQEAIVAQQAGAQIGATPNRDMHREALEAAEQTDPGQVLSGAVERVMQPIFDPRPPEPRYNEQGELIYEVHGVPAAPIFGGVGPGKAKQAAKQLSLLDKLTAAAPVRNPLPLATGKVPLKGGGVRGPTINIPQKTVNPQEALAAEREVLARAAAAKARQASAAGTREMNRAAQARNAGKVPAGWDEATEMARIDSVAAAREAQNLQRAAEEMARQGKIEEAAELRRLADQIEEILARPLRLPAPNDTIKRLEAAVRGQGKKLPSRPKGMGAEEYKELLRQATRKGTGPAVPPGIAQEFGARRPSAEWAAEYKTARDAFRANIAKTFAATGTAAGVTATILNSLMDDDEEDGSELPFGSRQHAEALDEFRGADAGDVEDPMMVNKETVPGRAADIIPQALVRKKVLGPGEFGGVEPKLPKNKKKRNQLFVAQEHRDRVSNLYLNAPHGERVSLEELHVQVPSNVKYKEALYKKAFYTGGVVTHHPNSPNSYIVVDPKTWKPTVYGPGDAARANADWRKRKNEQNILANPDKYRRKLVGRGRKNMGLALNDAMNSGDREYALMLHYNTRDKRDPRVRLGMGDFKKSDPIVERNFYGRGRRGISTRRGGTSIDRDAYLKYQQEYNDRFDKDRELTPEEQQIKTWQRGGTSYDNEMKGISATLDILRTGNKEGTEDWNAQLEKIRLLEELGRENAEKFRNLNLREERPGGFLEEFLPPEARLLPEYREGATVGQYGGATLLPPRAEERRKRLHDMMQPYFKEELTDENKKKRLKIPREFSTGVYGIDYAPKPGSDLPALQDKGEVVVPAQVTIGTKKVTISSRNVFEQANKLGEENNIPQAVANVQALVEYVKSNPDAIDEIESNIKTSWEEFISDKMKRPIKDKKSKKEIFAYDIPEINQALNELYMLGTGREDSHPMTPEGRRLAERERRAGPDARARPVPFQPF